MKIEYEFFSFERFGRMHENKNMFFFFLQKPGILIPNVVFLAT
jgi:hypothetical protein